MDKHRKFLKKLGDRIQDCLYDKGIKQADLVKKTGLGSPTVSGYINGDNEAGAAKIEAIARALGVSADYLLGITDVPTVDANLRSVCDYTGLSEEAVKALEKITSKGDVYKRILNLIMENESFQKSVDYIAQTLSGIAHLEKTQAIIADGLSKSDYELDKKYSHISMCDIPADIGEKVVTSTVSAVAMADICENDHKASIKMSKIDYLEAFQKLKESIIEQEEGKWQVIEDSSYEKQLKRSIAEMQAAKIEHAQRAK